MSYRDDLQDKVKRQAQRMEKASRERSVLAQLGYFGSLGLLFVLPVVGGAYLGAWLDRKMPDFSSSWTVSLIIVGVVVGAINVYLFIRNLED